MSTPANSKPEASGVTNVGILLYPTFQALDAFGPLDVLNILSWTHPVNLSLIAATLDPVSTKPVTPIFQSNLSNCAQSIVPTHTFENHPPLDVLLVPGGYGVVAEGIETSIEFIKKTYPSLKYVLTVCSGSWLAARAGILDGKRATSNKAGWDGTKQFAGVNWVPHARWVVDGNVWTASGVSAGIDAMLALVEEMHGADVAENISNVMEYDRHKDPNWDPFAEMYNL